MGCASSNPADAEGKAVWQAAYDNDVGSAADAMSDSMGKAVWQAARDNNEPELKRLIGLGWNVNWHNPSVRRRMRLAWAPGRFASTC